MGMVSPHHCQVGVEVQVSTQSLLSPDRGSTLLWGRVGIQAPHLVFTDTSVTRSGRSASFLLPLWPPLTKWGQGGSLIIAGLWSQPWPWSASGEEGKEKLSTARWGWKTRLLHCLHWQPSGLGAGESCYHMWEWKSQLPTWSSVTSPW